MKNTIKKIISLVCLVSVVLSAVACSKDKTNTKQGESPTVFQKETETSGKGAEYEPQSGTEVSTSTTSTINTRSRKRS